MITTTEIHEHLELQRQIADDMGVPIDEHLMHLALQYRDLATRAEHELNHLVARLTAGVS